MPNGANGTSYLHVRDTHIGDICHWECSVHSLHVFHRVGTPVYVRIIKTPSPKCACVASGYMGRREKAGSTRRTERLLAPVAKGIPTSGTSRHNAAVMAQPRAQKCFVGRIWGVRQTADCPRRSLKQKTYRPLDVLTLRHVKILNSLSPSAVFPLPFHFQIETVFLSALLGNS